MDSLLSRGAARWSIAAILALTALAASVKPASVPDGVTVVGEMTTTRKGAGVAAPRNAGGPGTDDPGRIHYPLISLKALTIGVPTVGWACLP